MPERSFGRTVRYRRTKLGLSQAQLGELVGRSASSIRSWERDVSVPTDASVITALSAILDLDQQELFEKAGVEIAVEESHPTVEEALASLAPLPLDEPVDGPDVEIYESLTEAGEPEMVIELPPPVHEPEIEPVLDLDSELEAEVREHLGATQVRVPDREPNQALETSKANTELVGASAMRSQSEPAYVSPPEPFLITAPTPPVVEPSYIEDTQQRQLYRVRTLATIVLVVALVVIFLWSLSNAIDAIGTWWEDFFGGLKL